MEIIGEKINGAIPSVAEAIATRNADKIKELAFIQAEAGADYLDVCAGTKPEEEVDTLKWLLEIVQNAVETPICIDSPDAQVLVHVLPEISHIGLINSVSNEGNKCEVLFPALAQTAWKIVALTCNDEGIPARADQKAAIGVDLIEKAGGYGIDPSRMYIDPLVFALSAVNDSLLSFNGAIEQIKEKYPTVHFTSGLSNISYGMPRRKIINQNFLAMALSAGMDSAIIDPTNKDVYATILAIEALLGKDKFCKNYNRAYRKGKI